MSEHLIEFLIYLKNYPEVVREESFSVSINLCELEVLANSFTYTIGDPDITESNFQISVSEACSHFDLQVEITGLPDFMSKSVNQQVIDVSQTDETELAGQYHATVKATVLIDDYPVIDSFTKIEHHANFVVDIIDPCLSTELEDPQLYDMHRIFG